MLVVVVQHAEKERDAGDPGLTPRGRDQAQRIADALGAEPVDVFLCSPLRRTRETAAPLARRLGREPVLDDRLVERMNWDGAIPLHEFVAEWDATTTDRDTVPRIGESSRAAGARFAALVRELGRSPGQRCVLVARRRHRRWPANTRG